MMFDETHTKYSEVSIREKVPLNSQGHNLCKLKYIYHLKKLKLIIFKRGYTK